MPKQWTELDYLSALTESSNSANPPEVQQALQKRIRQYERAQGPGFLGRATGIEAFEEKSGMSAPRERKRLPGWTPKTPKYEVELEKDESVQLPKEVGPNPNYERPGKIKGEDSSLDWFEPSLDEFRLEMGTVIGQDQAAEITEDDPLYQRYADAKWAQAYDKALSKGKTLVRVNAMPEGTLGEKASKYASKAGGVLSSTLLGIEEGGAGGLPLAATAALEEATGYDEDASEDIERARSNSPIGRTIGNVLGILSPYGVVSKVGGAATRALAPAAGRMIVKGGGKLGARMLGRGAVAAGGGAAGLSALGGAQDVAEGINTGTNPFDLDFLGRRALDAGIGAGAGVAGEALGSVAQRLAGPGALNRAQEAARESALAKRLGSSGSGALLGGAVGYTEAEKDSKTLGLLAGAAVGSMGGGGISWGKQALLRHLAQGSVNAGEGAFSAMAKRLSSTELPPDVVGAIRSKMLTDGAEVFGGRAAVAGKPGLPGVPSLPRRTATHGGEPVLTIPGQRAFPGRPATPGVDMVPPSPAVPTRRMYRGGEAPIPMRLPATAGRPGEPGVPAVEGRPPQTKIGGAGLFGIPFTSGVPGPRGGPETLTTLSQEEAEAFVRSLWEEEQATQPDEGEEDIGLDDSDETIEPTGLGGLPSSGGAALPALLERSGVFDETPDGRRASKDPEFTAVLEQLKTEWETQGIDDETIADYLGGYVRNYPAWRRNQDLQVNEDQQEGIERERNTEVIPNRRFDTEGFGGNDTLEDRQVSERTRVLQASDLPKMEKLLQTLHPKGYDIEDVIALVQRKLARTGQQPSPAMVEQSMKNLGYPIPPGWAKGAVTQRRRGEVSL